MLRIFLVIFLLAITGCAAAPSESLNEPETREQPAPQVVVPRNGQQPLVIEDDGTAAGKTLFDQARQIVALDAEIEAWRLKTSGTELPERQEVLSSMIDVMLQSREQAVSDLEQAWIATNSRAWGSASGHVESADRSIKTVRSALGGSIPDSIYCQTEISSVSKDNRIHYLPEGVYRDGGDDWVSYTLGARIKIGNYRFRISSEESGDYDEKVTILQNPFVHVIQPH